MKDMVSEKRAKPFENCRELFLELAAFYGGVVRTTYPCKWVMDDFKTHAVCTLEIESKITQSLFVTKEIHFAWKKGVDRLDSLII
ncbi:hypothetical protein ABFV83_10910 [Lacrimispora sp. BS-2]|uniref:Uncharacterized protein n=1 Tax=Lacrimispora sp. BS-2 TaxID=3151850 RepID=A0AAU7PJD4_9FIRM